jgi:lipid A disaccharide synthetase
MIITTGVSLTADHFLLLMGSVRDGETVQMIPCLVESMKELKPTECIQQACVVTNNVIKRKQQKQLQGPGRNQLPIAQSTLRKKFCIGKDFSGTEPGIFSRLMRVFNQKPVDLDLD